MKIAQSLAATGQFCTVEFITNGGEIRKLNGRANVRKYIKGTGKRSDDTAEKYLLIWTRKGSRKFDNARNINRSSIVSIKAHGVKLATNGESSYRQFV